MVHLKTTNRTAQAAFLQASEEKDITHLAVKSESETKEDRKEKKSI